jgi:feruloyl esterase
VEAQKYPSDFDGIVAGDPAIGDPFLEFNANAQHILQSSSAFIDAAAAELFNAAVLQACDGLDGVVDGLIQDPSKCHFDPATLECAPGQTTSCLSAGQVASLEAIFAGAVDTQGKPLYVGYSVSDVIESSNRDAAWGDWLTGCPVTQPQCHDPVFGPASAEPWTAQDPSLGSPGQWNFQDQFLRFFVFNNPNYDTRTLDFTNQQLINQVTYAVNRWGGSGLTPNLKPFVAQGHKLLMFHGWSDPALSPYISVQYYHNAAAILGSTTTDSMRLFMVPGMHHCQGHGPGPNTFDAANQVIQWVEDNKAPNRIIASHHINDDRTQPVDRTMPLCMYPTTAVYRNTGPINVAASWSCP